MYAVSVTPLTLWVEKIDIPVLASFIQLWIALFSHSHKVKEMWKQQTGRLMASYSKTRWWSRWEVMHQLMLQFGDVEPFRTRVDVSTSTRSQLLTILQKTPCHLLKVELAIDVGHSFVTATYQVEGDGPLIFDVYEEISVFQQFSKT